MLFLIRVTRRFNNSLKLARSKPENITLGNGLKEFVRFKYNVDDMDFYELNFEFVKDY
jgi:hypothetical protein